MKDEFNVFPKVYIILLNWNGWADTIECIESIYGNNYPNYQVVIVDNDSSDASLDKIKLWAESKNIPSIEYDYAEAINGGNIHKEIALNKSSAHDTEIPLVMIKSGRNLGFSDGNNIGIRYSIAKGDLEYLWILNNDTTINKDALLEMVKLAESDKRIGIVGSKLLRYYNPNIIQEIYGEINWKDNGKGIGLDENDKGQWDCNIEVSGRIMGASMLLKKELIDDIGLFDDKYFMEYEDADLCMRAKINGWKIFYCYKSKVFHKEGGTIAGDNKLKRKVLWRTVSIDTLSRFVIMRYYGLRNVIYFTKKFFKQKLLVFILFIIPRKLIIGIIKAILCSENKRIAISLIFKAIYDGLKGNMGKTISPQTGKYINNKNKTVLFIHNTMPHYRKKFFLLLSKKINTKYIFTKMHMSKVIYNVNSNISNMDDKNIRVLNNYFNIAVGLIPALLMEDFDVVVAPTMDNVIECLESIVTIIIAKIRRKKVIYFWERWNVPFEYMSPERKIKIRLKDIIAKPFIKWVDACIAPGTKSYEYFIDCGVNNSRIFIAPDASLIDEEEYKIEDIRVKHNIPKDKKIILYFGRIVKRKGLEILIKAFKELDRNGSYLLICGDGEFKQYCVELAERLNIRDICFTGFVPPEKRREYYSQCDLFVLPSYFYKGEGEPWGLSLNEAMQFGKPVIATSAVGSAYDLILSGKNGYIVEQGNEHELRRAIMDITVNPEKMNLMGNASRNIIQQFYKYDNMVDGFINAINFVIGESKEK
ncbi:MAG: glycosyltransferase [Bacillota bacterium]|nr:glycosyltransferase [Bacillota bacterium]